MIKYTLLCFVLALISLSSCDQQIKNERLQRIDSLGTHLNHVREVVQSVDSSLIENRSAEITKMGDWLLDNISDTLDPAAGIKVGDYLRCKKFFEKSLRKYQTVRGELRYSEKQLETLRKDVKNSFYSDEEFIGYFNTESESIKKLVEATDDLENGYNAVNDQYKSAKPAATSVIDSIKSVIYSSEPLSHI